MSLAPSTGSDQKSNFLPPKTQEEPKPHNHS